MPQAKKLYLEQVHARDELASSVKPPIDRVQLARYAGASADFNPMVVDEAYAKAAGLPSVHAPGMLAMAFLGQLVTDWARGGRVLKLGARFLKLVWPGDVLTAKGFVRERKGEGGKYSCELDLSCENQKGERMLRGWATVQLFYNADDEARQRRGEPPLVVEVKDEPPEEKGKKGKGGAQKPGKPSKPSKPSKTSAPARKPAPRKVAARSGKPRRAAKPSKPKPKKRGKKR